MALDFPSSPSVGQVYTYGDRSWTWNGEGWAANNTAASANTDLVISIVMQQY